MKRATARHDVLLTTYQRWLSDLTSIAIKKWHVPPERDPATVLHSQHCVFPGGWSRHCGGAAKPVPDDLWQNAARPTEHSA